MNCRVLVLSKFKTMLSVKCLMLYFIIIFVKVKLSNSSHLIFDDSKNFHKLPRFWTNTGFCPAGDINFESISSFLLTNDVRLHLNLIGALPNGAITSIRVHWLLELITLNEINKDGIPVYNFEKLDKFLEWVDEAGLSIGFEFMGNPGEIFSRKNHLSKKFLWTDLSYQITERYLEFYGVDKISKWKFETWNEPDLKTYNTLNFTVKDYLDYIYSLRFGLDAASRRTYNKTHFELRGPAGLFKSEEKHHLCWAALEICNSNPKQCPLDILTFHKKGKGNPDEITAEEKSLLTEIFEKYPKLINYPISNDEADPIAGWSTPRTFQSNIEYAVKIVSVVLNHWSMKLNSKKFKNFESISHDNAFLSYHPHEFNQRTLFARFQMNRTNPLYSQFVPKPAYTVLGMLGNLGEYASDVDFLPNTNLNYLITTSSPESPYYMAMLSSSPDQNVKTNLSFTLVLPKRKTEIEMLAICLEVLETNETNPVEMWNLYGNPFYPNQTEREWMRRVQGPKIIELGILKPQQKLLSIHYELKSPWVAMLRICSSEINSILKPVNIRILKVTKGEVIIFWDEIPRKERCIKTYEVQFMMHKETLNETIITKRDKRWNRISRGWRVPFLSFQYTAKNGIIEGFYKVRAVDIFGHSGPFSDIKHFKDN